MKALDLLLAALGWIAWGAVMLALSLSAVRIASTRSQVADVRWLGKLGMGIALVFASILLLILSWRAVW